MPHDYPAIAQLSQGGVGLIITSHAYARPRVQAGPWQLGIYKDELIESLSDGKCWGPLLGGKGIRCVVEEELKGKE